MVEEKTGPSGTEAKESPGRLYYGYIIVVCTFVILLVIFGTNYSFGIFFNRLLQEFGWSRAVTSTGYSIGQILGGLLGIFTGRLGDRFGPRNTVLVCLASLIAGCFLMSTINQPWHLYIFYGGLIGFGVGGAAIPLSANISRWFERRRGLMTGIVVAGIGTGTILMPLLNNFLLETFDFRKTFIILGILVSVVVIPLALLLKNDTPKRGGNPAGGNSATGITKPAPQGGIRFKEALRSSQFWLICAVYLVSGFYIQGVMVHIVPYARSTGIEAGSAAVIMSFLGIGSVLGRVVMGTLSDTIGVKYTLAVSLGLILLTFVWLLMADATWMLYLFATFYGFGYGSMIAMQTLAPARLFGLVSLGTFIGTFVFVYTCGGAVGPVITGLLYDVTGSYRTAFIIFAALAAAGLILALCLKQAPRKARIGNASR